MVLLLGEDLVGCVLVVALELAQKALVASGIWLLDMAVWAGHGWLEAPLLEEVGIGLDSVDIKLASHSQEMHCAQRRNVHRLTW